MTSRYPGGLIRKNAANTAITGASGVWDLGSQAQAVKNNTWPISGLANPVSGSLRFRDGASARLTRTPASASNRRTYTISAWVKLGSNSDSSVRTIFCGGDSSTSASTHLYFYLNSLRFYFGGAGGPEWTTSQKFRDHSSWYHIVAAVDTTQATFGNRLKLYINGTEVTSWSAQGTGGNTAQNSDTQINNSVGHGIGSNGAAVQYLYDGYMAEFNFIDGQQLTPASFGQTSAITGVWEPIKYTGTYGTNGFYLSLSDTSSIGKDFSGNVNNWTPNNISTTSGATFDLMRDVPTQYTPQGATDVGGVVRGNFAILNPLDPKNGTQSNANLTHAMGSNDYASARSTIGIKGGKWYWEAKCETTLQSNFYMGIGITADGDYSGYNYIGSTSGGYSYDGRALKLNNNNSTSYGASYTLNDIIGVALDLDNGTIEYYKNGASQGVAFTGIDITRTYYASHWIYTTQISYNFGQQPFTYTPPTGFKSLCTTNLPTPTIGATAETAANKYFDASLYTGNGTSVSVTNSGSMQPDFVWVKSRSNALNNCLMDSVRGISRSIFSDTTDAELFFAGYYVTSFNSNGFTAGLGTGVNQNAATYVGWQWRASNTTAVTNTSGSITSTVSANTTAGFSIVTYSITSASATISTFGHGLGVAPSMVILKVRNSVDDWTVYHSSIPTPNSNWLTLNSTAAAGGATSTFSSSSTTFGVRETRLVAAAGSGNVVAYCFAQVAGYSAFGSYTGNGSSDGPFIYLGFRPRFILIRRTDAAGGWKIYNTSGLNYNPINTTLETQDAAAEATSASFNMDWLSNGFKLRTTYGDFNTSSSTYIYMAFAETPFKNSLAR